MTCRTVQAKLSAYIDGELSGFEMLDIRSHLHCCPGCSTEMEQIRQLKWALGSLPENDPGPEFAANLYRVSTNPPLVRARRLPLAAVTTLAFAAALLVSLQVLRTSHHAAPTGTSFAAQANHSNFDLDRDQAYQSGGDYFNDGTFIFTASAPASYRH